MLTRKILGGLAVVMPLFGLGCQGLQQQSCCSPCQCQAAPAAPCGTNSCCSSNERRPLFAAKRKGECCETASPCAKPACDCGCGSAAPAKQPTPAPAPAPASNLKRPAFNPFAVTETSQSSAPCDCSNGSATQPASSMMPSRAPFNPLAITDSGGPVVASHQPAQLPSSMPTSYYHNDDYTMLVGELH